MPENLQMMCIYSFTWGVGAHLKSQLWQLCSSLHSNIEVQHKND